LSKLFNKLILLLSLFFIGCMGDVSKNLEELDKVYGKCDNPHRNITRGDYEICKAEEAAMSGYDKDPSKKSVLSLLPTLNRQSDQNFKYVNTPSINSSLWQGSLKTLNIYPIKIADSTGGYIETDWIMTDSEIEKRCLIKVSILSTELVSNGIDVNFICQTKSNNQWVYDKQQYPEESKQLALKILNTASEINTQQL